MTPLTEKVFLPWATSSPHPTIIPFFLPFRGCPGKCLFCAQDVFTRVSINKAWDLQKALEALKTTLEERLRLHLAPCELAFYGGTFTALPEAEFAMCLDFAHMAVSSGLICALRCSTRPDYLAPSRLELLQKAHFTTIELGIQSFAEEVLLATKRGYPEDIAYSACMHIKDLGFTLGVQLLPGLPKATPQTFIADVRTALSLKAELLRFYPCLVVANTGLARLWQVGRFKPWDVPTTIDALAAGLRIAWDAQVPVIRMGLAPQMDASAILAGPLCADLGARVQAKALLQIVQAKAYPKRLSKLYVPKRLQGCFWGHKGEMRKDWASIGLGSRNVHFAALPYLELVF
ncbi:MAG: radical SAM protein [Desulfovibrionaceae bacterium]|nr:radical SAM protein [Desulfovibrionaceae bacterium]